MLILILHFYDKFKKMLQKLKELKKNSRFHLLLERFEKTSKKSLSKIQQAVLPGGQNPHGDSCLWLCWSRPAKPSGAAWQEPLRPHPAVHNEPQSDPGAAASTGTGFRQRTPLVLPDRQGRNHERPGLVTNPILFLDFKSLVASV